VTINDTTILDTIALSDGYIGKYKIKGSEKSFCIANGEGPWYGSITILISGIINDNAVTPNISLFPNPTYSTISIKDLQTAEIFVYGQCGQLVKSFTFKNTKIIVNLSEQKQGIYFFEIISNKNRGVYKILKL
jgi:hypothetical protein